MSIVTYGDVKASAERVTGVIRCGPCKALAPVLEEVAVEQAGRLRVSTVQQACTACAAATCPPKARRGAAGSAPATRPR